MPIRFVDDQPSTKSKIRFLDDESAQTSIAPQSTNKNYPGQGIVMGVTDPIYGVGQMVPRGLSAITSLGGLAPNPVSRLYDQSANRMDEATKTREEQYQSGRENNNFDWGRLTGNVISPVNALAAGPINKAAQATTLAGKVLGGAAVGSGISAAAPVTGDNFSKEKLNQMAWGAGGGALAPLAGSVIGKVLNPKTDIAAKGLLSEGVKLTPGEIAGGIVKRGEDALSSVPILGSVIKGAQRRSIESLNTTAINRALEPLGKQLPKNVNLGRDAISYVEETLGSAYDNLLPKLTGKIDDQFADDMNNLFKMVDDDFIMNDQTKQKFGKIMNELVINRVSETGSVTGQAIKEIESRLGDLSKTLGKSLDPSDSQLSDVLSEVQDTLREMVTRSNPDHAKELKAINTGWANFKRVQRAASSTASDKGIFNPAQLQSAVKALDRSKDKASFARGTALMQDLSDPARSRMAASLPNSGTADRAMAAATLFSLGSGASVSPMVIPAAAIAAGYVPGGRRIAQALLAERPQIVRQLGSAVSKYSPYLSGPAALQLSRQQGQ